MTFWNIFLIFPRKQDLTVHVNCLHWKQFAWNFKSCFLGKNKKNIINLPSAEFAREWLRLTSCCSCPWIEYVCFTNCSQKLWGWLGVAKVSCILRHQGVKLILAYTLAMPTILVAGKGRGGMFLFMFFHFHSCSSFSPVPVFHLFYYLSLFSLSLGDDTKWPTRVDVSLNPNTININHLLNSPESGYG